MSFEDLLGKLNEAATLAKALPAAGDAGSDGTLSNDDGDDDEELKKKSALAGGDDDGDDDDGDDGNGEQMTKSFQLQLEDGTMLEAFDGTDMLKSLTTRVEIAESALQENEGQVLKSLNAAVDLISGQAVKLAEQGELIKSLQTKVEKLANSGRGRMSTLSPDAEFAKSLSAATVKALPMGREEILSKSMAALTAGRISGADAIGIETRLNMSMAISPDMLQRIQ